MSQTDYIGRVLDRFNMQSAKSASTPLPIHLRLSQRDCPTSGSECTTTSTTEAEYVSASDAAKEALWFGRLAHTFRQVDSDSAPVVYINSQGVVALSKNWVHHKASKHIHIRYHFVPDCVISGKINLEKISTTDNVANGMTKCLLADHFRSLRHQMGVPKNWSG